MANRDRQNQRFVLLLLSLLLILSSCKRGKESSVTQSPNPEPGNLEFYKEHSVITNPDDLFAVKRSLIQDLAALNKIEVEVWDTTSFMDIDEHQNIEASNLLHQIAEITISPRDRLPELQAIYENHSELQIPIN